MSDPVKILILEDSEDDIVFLQHEFKRSGMQVELKIARTRESYVEALKMFVPEIILSDYSLPRFDGQSAFQLKQDYWPDIPFIMISGVIGEENAVQLIKSGITDYVLKDNLRPLISKIGRALNEAEYNRQKRISDELVKLQNEQLFQIAFLQSHQLQTPVTNILDLLNAINFDEPASASNLKLIGRIEILTKVLDDIIHQIVRKAEKIKNN